MVSRQSFKGRSIYVYMPFPSTGPIFLSSVWIDSLCSRVLELAKIGVEAGFAFVIVLVLFEDSVQVLG
jgi:hypothetical protein